MRRVLPLGLALGLALPLIAAPRPTSAATLKEVGRATIQKGGNILAWVTKADGSIDLDAQTGTQTEDLLNGATVVLSDAGQGVGQVGIFKPAQGATGLGDPILPP